MWNAIGETIKVFFEKHLIPSVISLVAAGAVYLYLPPDNWMIVKLGKSWFIILVAGVAFLAIQLVLVIVKGIRYCQEKRYVSNENRKNRERENREGLEEWLSFMDALSPEDRDFVIRLIKNDNTPVEEHGYVWHGPDSIHHTNLVVKTTVRGGVTLTKLDEKAYKVLKAIYEDRGSITHF